MSASPVTRNLPKKFLRRFLLFVAAVMLLYVGTFATWWCASPRTERIEGGRRFLCVEFHMTPFRWQTRYLWLPAFLALRYVFGYSNYSSIESYEESVYTLVKRDA